MKKIAIVLTVAVLAGCSDGGPRPTQKPAVENPAPRPTRAPSLDPEGMPADELAKLQADREEAIKGLQTQGVLRSVYMSKGGQPVVVAAPAFIALPYESKALYLRIVYAYSWHLSERASMVVVRHWQTGKIVGDWSPAVGLRWD